MKARDTVLHVFTGTRCNNGLAITVDLHGKLRRLHLREGKKHLQYVDHVGDEVDRVIPEDRDPALLCECLLLLFLSRRE